MHLFIPLCITVKLSLYWTRLKLAATNSSHKARRSLKPNKENHQSAENTRKENYILLHHRHTLIKIKMFNASIICASIDNFRDSKARLDNSFKCVCV